MSPTSCSPPLDSIAMPELQVLVAAALGHNRKTIYRICDLFGTITNRKLFLDSRQLCKTLRWKQQTDVADADGNSRTSNKILLRIMEVMDGDGDAEVDFREFSVMVAMMREKCPRRIP